MVLQTMAVARQRSRDLPKGHERNNCTAADERYFLCRSMLRCYKQGQSISGRESQGAWRQDKQNGGKPPVIKKL
jgi:hypothetical protein